MTTYPDYGVVGPHVVKGIGDGTSQSTPFEQAVVTAGGINLDHSIPLAVMPPATYTSLKTVAANPSRRGWLAISYSQYDLWLKLSDGIGNNPTWLPLASGGVDGKQGAAWGWSDFPHLGQIELFGPPGSVYFTLAEI